MLFINKPHSQGENISDYLNEITRFVLPLKSKTKTENCIVSKWKLLTPILENQKLSSGVYQTPKDTAFQDIFGK